MHVALPGSYVEVEISFSQAGSLQLDPLLPRYGVLGNSSCSVDKGTLTTDFGAAFRGGAAALAMLSGRRGGAAALPTLIV